MKEQDYYRCPRCHEAIAEIAKDDRGNRRFNCEKHGDFKLVSVIIPEVIIGFLHKYYDFCKENKDDTREEEMLYYFARCIVMGFNGDFDRFTGELMFIEPNKTELAKKFMLQKIVS